MITKERVTQQTLQKFVKGTVEQIFAERIYATVIPSLVPFGDGRFVLR